MFKNISPFWFLVIGLVFLIWVPHLLCLGMFMDGVYDALLAENLYKGISTFWAPQTIYYSQPAYWDNPPLAMWTLATCYKFFGDHYIVERVYSWVCAIIQVGLIAVLWRTIFSFHKNIKSYAWLPCLIWLMSSLIGWCYTNNMLEDTMAIFTTSAMILSVWYVNRQKYLLPVSVGIGIILLLAFITKGPVALFPLALPVLFIGFKEQFQIKQAVIFTALQLLFFVAFFGMLYAFPAPHNFFNHYYELQVKKAITHTSADANAQWQIFIDLFLATFLYMILAMVRRLGQKWLRENASANQVAVRMLLLGLCGTLPIALSAKQHNYYLLPAMTAIATSAAAYLLPLAAWVEERIRQFSLSAIIKWVSGGMVVLAIFLCVHNKGLVIRDAEMLADLKTANELLAGETVVRADWALFSEWSIRAYLLRLYGKKICMPDEQAPAHFYMTKPGKWGDKLPGNAPKIYSGKTFDLYKL